MHVIVSYCGNERPFLRTLLHQCALFAATIIVSVGERLYTGDPEDEANLAILRDEFKGVKFVRYAVPVGARDYVGLHNASRSAGVAELDRLGVADNEWVLLLDGDEVPDGAAVRTWRDRVLANVMPDENPQVPNALKCANYWYFGKPTLRAKAVEDSVLLVRRRLLTPAALCHPRERDGIVMQPGVRLARNVGGSDGSPLYYHFSWCRAAGVLRKKVAAWGHSADRPWQTILDQLDQTLASRVALTTEPIHGYELEEVPLPSWLTLEGI